MATTKTLFNEMSESDSKVRSRYAIPVSTTLYHEIFAELNFHGCTQPLH